VSEREWNKESRDNVDKRCNFGLANGACALEVNFVGILIISFPDFFVVVVGFMTECRRLMYTFLIRYQTGDRPMKYFLPPLHGERKKKEEDLKKEEEEEKNKWSEKREWKSGKENEKKILENVAITRTIISSSFFIWLGSELSSISYWNCRIDDCPARSWLATIPRSSYQRNLFPVNSSNWNHCIGAYWYDNSMKEIAAMN